MFKSLGKTVLVRSSGSVYCGCFQSTCCEHVALGGTSVMAGNVLSVCTVTLPASITAVESSGSKQFLQTVRCPLWVCAAYLCCSVWSEKVTWVARAQPDTCNRGTEF